MGFPIEAKDDVEIHGALTVEVINANGELKYYYENHNLIANGGLPTVSGLIGAVAGYTAFGYMGVGTVNGTPAAADTQLNGGGEVMRVATTNTQVTTTVTDDTLQLVGAFTFSTSYALYEAGVFNGATVGAGTMLAEASIGTVTVVSGDSVNITWKIQV